MTNDPPGGLEAISPRLGILPRSRTGRAMFAFAASNVVLALLPVFTPLGNGSGMVLGLLPGTIFYAYAAFTLNFVFALTFWLVRARPWARALGADRETRAR